MNKTNIQLKNLGVKPGEIVYVPVPALTPKQAVITYNFKIVKIISLILLVVNLISGGIATYNLFTFTRGKALLFLSKQAGLVTVALSLWVTCLSVSVLFEVAILTFQRLNVFSPKTGWGLLVDLPQPDKNPEVLENIIRESVLIGKGYIKKFKFIWLFTLGSALITLVLTYLDFPKTLLPSVRAFVLSVVVNGLLNFWLQFNFDDLKVLVGKFKAEEIRK